MPRNNSRLLVRIAQGKRLHTARIAAGIRNDVFAAKLGVSADALHTYEHGETGMSEATLQKVEKLLGDTTNWIKKGDPQ